MDYRYLKAFVLTARYKSFSKAGTELKVAQSAISRQIRLLEESLKCQLILRAPNYLVLTEAGKKLYKHATQFDEWLNNEFHASTPSVRIGSIPGVLDYLVLPVIKKHQTTGKHVNFNIISAVPSRLLELLSLHEIDLCITHTPVDLNHLICKKLFDEDIVLISKTAVNVEKVSQYPWIHMGSASYLKKLSKEISSKTIQVNSLDTIISFVEQGLGVAAVPEFFLKGRSRDLKKYSLGFKGSIYLSYYKLDIWPEHLREFVDNLKEHKPA